MVQRILSRGGGRSDDNPETVNKRLVVYRESTQPIIKRFQSEGKLVQIDADGDVESIFNRVQQGLSLS